jgi:beta-RFAP synthase
MPREVVITTGARLHFGILSHGAASPRQFGGVGVMIDQPGFVIRARRASADDLQCGLWQARVATLLSRLRAPGTAGTAPPPMCIAIEHAPAEHAGLGSGTQLGMAVARICSILSGEAEVTPEALARRAGRGRRSAVGLYGFQVGGLLVEAGKSHQDDISPLAARVDFPGEWRFLLVRPRGAEGISGTEEAGGFARLLSMPETLTDRLCRLALMEILPSAIERDFSQASESIGRFGRLVGEYFAPVQGGVFADERMRRLAERLEARQIRGVGQSSWGPTLFILCPGAAFAEDLARELASESAACDCEFTIAAPLNRGATIECY